MNNSSIDSSVQSEIDSNLETGKDTTDESDLYPGVDFEEIDTPEVKSEEEILAELG